MSGFWKLDERLGFTCGFEQFFRLTDRNHRIYVPVKYQQRWMRFAEDSYIVEMLTG